jgi:hypothetical protein
MEAGKKPSTSVSFEECLRRVLSGEYECRHMPENPVEPGEVVLGTLENPIAKSMYSLWHEMDAGSKKFFESLPEDRSDLPKEEIRRLKSQMHQLRSRIECAKSFFWEMAYSAFPKARDPGVSIGIRSNWTVVIYKSQSLLESLLGGSGPFG